MKQVKELALAGKEAARVMAQCDTERKNNLLLHIADTLIARQEEILSANLLDVEAGKHNGLSPSLIDRLTLTPRRMEAMADGTRQVAGLPDPVSTSGATVRRPNGLQITQRRVPLGLIGMIYEARPNVTIDAAVLCLKAGNAVLLRGGKEAIHSNKALTRLIRDCLAQQDLPADSVCLIEDTSRASASEMMGLSGLIDVLIPRGGAGLIQSVVQNARVPVIQTGVGNCHVYIHAAAPLDMALDILYNAKTNRVSVCNAAESLLVDAAVADEFLPKAKARLDEKNVVWYGCERTSAILGDSVRPAGDEEYAAEFLDYALSCKVVDGLDAAAGHIARYSSGHSEAIVTADYFAARQFTDRVDSAAVYVNASTRFTDGEVFGLGAEMGISTQKLHARGPFGLEALTSTKWVVLGEGQVR